MNTNDTKTEDRQLADLRRLRKSSVLANVDAVDDDLLKRALALDALDGIRCYRGGAKGYPKLTCEFDRLMHAEVEDRANARKTGLWEHNIPPGHELHCYTQRDAFGPLADITIDSYEQAIGLARAVLGEDQRACVVARALSSFEPEQHQATEVQP